MKLTHYRLSGQHWASRFGRTSLSDYAQHSTISIDKKVEYLVPLNLKRKDFGRIINDKLSYFGNTVGLNKDPYFSFDFILDSLKNKKVSAILYFKSGVSHPRFDKNIYNVSDPKIKEVFKTLHTENVEIGLHPSYHTFDNKEKMREEFEALQIANSNHNLVNCRQHYLRFSIPETWRIMDEIGFKNDSSMVYSKEAGFRCGVCYSFPVFDCENRKMLSLQESPLIFMETPILEDEDKIINQVEKLTGKAAKADHISSRTVKAINLKMEEDPIYFRKLADLIKQTIAEYHQKRIDEAEYLRRAKANEEEFLNGRTKRAPEELENNEVALAFYNFSESIFEDVELMKTKFHIEVSLAIDNTVKNHIYLNQKKIVDWDNNEDITGKINIEIGDALYELMTKYEMDPDWKKIDNIIEECLKIAILKYK